MASDAGEARRQSFTFAITERGYERALRSERRYIML